MMIWQRKKIEELHVTELWLPTDALQVYKPGDAIDPVLHIAAFHLHYS